MTEQPTGEGPLGRSSPLQSARGSTTISDAVVSKVVGIAAQEVEGVQMGGGTSRAVGGFLDSVTGGAGLTRGVVVEVGEVETLVELTMAVEYGRPIPRLLDEVRRNVINRIGGLIGLDVVAVNITVNDVLLPEERPQLERQREVEREAQEQEMRS